MEVKANIQLKRLDDSRLKDVQFLYESVFKKPISLDVLLKKYDTGYTGIKHVTFLAYDSDKPIAFYGSLPQRINYNGKSILTVLTCDSITLPAYQGQGLHKRLALKAYELMRKQGVQFVYAFHSENTFHSCKKLDWELAFTMKGFLIKTNNIPVIKAIRKIGPLNRWADSHSRNVLKSHTVDDKTFENSNLKEGVSIDYSLAFFNYKSFTNNMVIELENVRFWIKVSSGIMVGDVNFKSESELLKGIEGLKKLTYKLGLNEILFQTTRGTKLEHILSKHFAGFESWKVGYFLFDENLDVSKLQINFGDIDTF